MFYKISFCYDQSFLKYGFCYRSVGCRSKLLNGSLLRAVNAQRPIEKGARKVDVLALEYRMKAEFQDSEYNGT